MNGLTRLSVTKLGHSVISGISAMLKACAPRSLPPTTRDFVPDASLAPGKTGHPPSKCYGSEMSCHSDSW
jgi:hypothetical protein